MKMRNKEIEMMIKDDTLKEIKNCEPKRQDALMNVVKNCAAYVVTPEGNAKSFS